MAYALISWDPPSNLDADEIQTELEDALTLNAGARKPIILHRRLWLYRSPPAGIGFSTVRKRVAAVVKKNPGLEVLIIMPDKGDTVAGWLDPMKGSFPEARPIMNQDGSSTFPWLLPRPAADGGGGA